MKIEFVPTGGVNNYDNYARLQPTEVEDGANLLFERKRCFNRPGLSQITFTGFVGPLVFGQYVPVSGLTYNLGIGASGRIFNTGLATTEITGAGTSFDAAIYNNVCSVDGTVIFGNNLGGLVQWTPSAGNTYNVIAGAPFRYVTGHQARAVAAYQNSGGSALSNARTFAWSKPGDVTNWLASDGSAGQLAIADIEDQITGIGVLHNIVVIPHQRGIHLAYPTGTLPLPYDVQSFTKVGDGCYFPSTAAWSDEMFCYVGQANVYSFDLTQATPIGTPIRQQLMNSLNVGIVYRGFFTRAQSGASPRLRYNLFPINSAVSPHYIYDFEEGHWSLHFYSTPAAWAWNVALITGAFDFGIGFASQASTPVLNYWNGGVACEQAAYFTRYLGVLEAQEFDFQVNDIIVRAVDGATPNVVTVTLSAIQNNIQSTASATKNMGGGNTGRYTRQYFTRGSSDLRLTGNEFVVKVQVAAGTNFATDYVALITGDQPQGAYRGY